MAASSNTSRIDQTPRAPVVALQFMSAAFATSGYSGFVLVVPASLGVWLLIPTVRRRA